MMMTVVMGMTMAVTMGAIILRTTLALLAGLAFLL